MKAGPATSVVGLNKYFTHAGPGVDRFPYNVYAIAVSPNGTYLYAAASSESDTLPSEIYKINNYFQNNVSDKSIQYYLLLHINKKKNYSTKEIKIRFLLDNKKEFLTSIEINFKQPMISLNLNDLLDLDKAGEFNKGIIQIESLYDNVRGHFYICDNKNSIVATDHLTGG